MEMAEPFEVNDETWQELVLESDSSTAFAAYRRCSSSRAASPLTRSSAQCPRARWRRRSTRWLAA